MPRPRDATVWNEDLVRALRAREDQCRQQGSQRQYAWRDGAIAIAEVRSDIYVFRTGRIVGLPKLKKTVDEECRAIIAGRKPILPPGYLATTTEERQLVPSGNPYDNDPYLKNIKARGGAYAILLAFHHSAKQTLTKDQICRAAQPFCDEPMKESFHDGRYFGAWKSKDTLVKHGLLTQNNSRQFGERGWRSNGVWTWTLNDNGRQFIQALLRKFPQGAQKPNNYHELASSPGNIHASPAGGNSLHAIDELFSMSSDFPMQRLLKTPPARKGRRNDLADKDEQELRDWLATAQPGEQRKFKVGKERRKRIHDLCQELVDHTPGLRLRHESAGEGNARALFITVETRGNVAPMAALRGSSMMKLPLYLADDVPSLHAEGHFGTPEFELDSKQFAQGVVDDGRNLSTSKRDILANAAAFRCAMTESKIEYQRSAQRLSPAKRQLSFDEAKIPSVALLNGEDMDRKPAAKKLAGNRKIVCHLDDSDDESISHVAKKEANVGLKTNETPIVIDLNEIDNLQASPNLKKKAKKMDRQQFYNENEEVIDLVDSQECFLPTTISASHALGSPSGRNLLDQPAALPNDDDDDIIDLADSQESVALIFNPYLSNDQPNNKSEATAPPNEKALTIVIDDRERIKNSSPRNMRMELTRHMQSGMLKSVWPPEIPLAEVIEKKLNYGDFAFVIGAESNSERRLPLSIERKRVADLVQRSVQGDHWKQLQRMRDCCRCPVMLIEGDTRTASQFVAFGSQNKEEWNPAYYCIDDEESLFRFVGRAVLSSPSVRFFQAKDEQATHRAVGALGLMAFMSEQHQAFQEAPESTPSASIAQTCLCDRLVTAGVPWELSRRVADEIGSIKQLDLLYDECTSEVCKSALLCPIISSIQLPGSTSSKEDWSDAIFRAYFSTFNDPADGRRLFDDYKLLTENHAIILGAMHAEQNHEAAIDVALSGNSKAILPPRRVAITLSDGLQQCFENPTEGSFYTLNVTEQQQNTPIQTIVMQTNAGNLVSHRLFIHVVPAKMVVATVQKKMTLNSESFVRAAKRAAGQLNQECSVHEFNPGLDRHVIVFQGMMAACDAAAKQPAYRLELRVVIDMVIAELMYSHETVVLQTVRKTGDLSVIVRQLALACFHYHLLTQEKGPI
jgi:hypothetical protein